MRYRSGSRSGSRSGRQLVSKAEYCKAEYMASASELDRAGSVGGAEHVSAISAPLSCLSYLFKGFCFHALV